MKAKKKVFSVEIEVLSIDSIPALLYELAGIVREENIRGDLYKEDGDCIKWGCHYISVEF